ncbi:hypothetical protein [Arthrobacter agilis]|jgi:hypothetical protein|uniref:hypothetical protein n=1 Tax=Arthrobacter agilis TaxID=37921 RepID=UPI002780101E|nr:hypothetical protein [Arthrobacter agilis]MDQ0735287.1 hypothetical protein [Arthrobacter agilis]
MTPEEPHDSSRPLDGGQGLKNALRRVFDAQIPNYGDYNLVFAAGRARGAVPAAAYVVGYRWKPAELMIAPVDLVAITGAGVPVEVNMTNLAHALQWDEDDSFEVGTSTGRVFRFTVLEQPVLDIGPGTPLRLAQDEDAADFTSFMDAFIAMS